MPRFPVHSVADAPEAAREPLRALEKKYGRVPNIHGEMAHAPAVLAAYTGIQQAIIEHGSFDARTREAIALAVGTVDNCTYCQAAHTAAGRAAGWSLEQTVALRKGTPLQGQENSARYWRWPAKSPPKWARSTRTPGRRPRPPGAPTRNWPNCFAHVMANIFTNYFNHYAHTELDMPAAPALTGAPS
ncbi:MAG: peroxidase-related enzyme [Mycobacterium sp.]